MEIRDYALDVIHERGLAHRVFNITTIETNAIQNAYVKYCNFAVL